MPAIAIPNTRCTQRQQLHWRRRSTCWRCVLAIVAFLGAYPTQAQAPKASAGNRLAYLDEVDPYYPHAKFPKLITPQWVGEQGVEAVVILAIDDMRDTARYETYLRPILRRLQQIDGRAPVSIMTNTVDPKDPQLQTWLKEGLSLECHTIDHPCPFFKIGFEKAKSTYERCIDLMHEIPGNKPVAFRMPCCDSLNTPSPRFYAEIFNKTTEKGNFLSIDSSVFTYYTSGDPELPKNLVLDSQGQERFKRYLPLDRSFVNTIENYPYPYVIGNLCWQFPCMTPSDWQAQHLQKPNNPQTVEDWKIALDCTVIKQGVFCMVYHPHGWIRSDQVVEFIDHAVAKHGKKVKFLTFREAGDRLFKARPIVQHRRIMQPVDPKGLHAASQEVDVLGNRQPFQIGSLQDHGSVSMKSIGKIVQLRFRLPPGARLSVTDGHGHDHGLRFLDLNADGKLDIIFSNEKEYGIYLFTDMEKGWSKKVLAGKRGGEPGASAPGSELPMISRNGQNNGFFVHSGYLWWSNEDTALLKDHVDRRKIATLLGGTK